MQDEAVASGRVKFPNLLSTLPKESEAKNLTTSGQEDGQALQFHKESEVERNLTTTSGQAASQAPQLKKAFEAVGDLTTTSEQAAEAVERTSTV